MHDVVQFNKQSWNKKVEENNRWTQPVSPAEIAAARTGRLELLLTPSKPVPADWYPPLASANVLCLASGGGQQAPLFAAAGAKVTSFDNSPRQLEQDKMVAEREALEITTIEGDMADLSIFADQTFDFIFNPVSTCFIPTVIPVWRECFRVLKEGRTLITGFSNPVEYCFDTELYDQGIFTVKYALPYSELTSISEQERIRLFGPDEAIEFSHTFQDQIDGQLAAGFHLIGFFEDYWEEEKIKDYMPSFFATRAWKPFSSPHE